METGGILIARIFWRLAPPCRKSALLLCLLPFFGAHADITNTASERALPLLNRIEYSPSLTASGQPTAEALELAARSGYSRVIFLAFTNHQNALGRWFLARSRHVACPCIMTPHSSIAQNPTNSVSIEGQLVSNDLVMRREIAAITGE